MTCLHRTPLYANHCALGARFIAFGGWEMPVQYTGILEEHHAVRAAAGLFDISHMGEIYVSGPTAEAFLNHLLTNNIAKVAIGTAQYNLMCNEHGGIIDDLIVYRIEPTRFLLVINAASIEKDMAWISEQNRFGAAIENASDSIAALALQGPQASQIIKRLLPDLAQKLPRHGIARENYQEINFWIARTGYTGEDGFEIFLPAESAVFAWELLLSTGADLGLKPCGLGARDTLRLEMGYPLYGSDLTDKTTPIEAGLATFVDLDKTEFIGKETLQFQKRSGTKKRLMAFRMIGKGALPRAHCAIRAEGKQIGETTSGTLSPSLGIGIGMGYVESAYAKMGQRIEIEIRSRLQAAVTAAKPLYQKPNPTKEHEYSGRPKVYP